MSLPPRRRRPPADRHVQATGQGVFLELDPMQILADLAEVPKRKPPLKLVRGSGPDLDADHDAGPGVEARQRKSK